MSSWTYRAWDDAGKLVDSGSVDVVTGASADRAARAAVVLLLRSGASSAAVRLEVAKAFLVTREVQLNLVDPVEP